MNPEFTTGIYRMDSALRGDKTLWSKNDGQSLPFRREAAAAWGDRLDRILLEEQPEEELLGCVAVYPDNFNRWSVDYGHWELLLSLFLIALWGEQLEDETRKDEWKNEFLDGAFHWTEISSFWKRWVLSFRLSEFIRLADEELDEKERVLRDVAESAKEYVLSCPVSCDEALTVLLEKMLRHGRLIVVVATTPDESLSVAASMFAAYRKLLNTNLTSLKGEWPEF